jgi:hypothetical protein
MWGGTIRIDKKQKAGPFGPASVLIRQAIVNLTF